MLCQTLTVDSFHSITTSGRLITAPQDMVDITTTRDRPLPPPIENTSASEGSARASDTGVDSGDVLNGGDRIASEESSAVTSTSVSASATSIALTLLSTSAASSVTVTVTAAATVSSADVWCVEEKLQKGNNYCTRDFLSKCDSNSNEATDDTIQPAYRLINTDMILCTRCSKLIDSSKVNMSFADLQSFTCASDKAVDMGFTYPSAGDILKQEALALQQHRSRPLLLYTKRALLKETLYLQSTHNSLYQHSRNYMQVRMQADAENDFKSRLQSGVATTAIFEIEKQQNVARRTIDYEKIKTHAEEYLEEQRGTHIDLSFLLLENCFALCLSWR